MLKNLAKYDKDTMSGKFKDISAATRTNNRSENGRSAWDALHDTTP
jgi:hypothetical protein